MHYVCICMQENTQYIIYSRYCDVLDSVIGGAYFAWGQPTKMEETASGQ